MSTSSEQDSAQGSNGSPDWWRAETNRRERSNQVRIELRAVLAKLSMIDDSRQLEIDQAIVFNEDDQQLLERISKTSGLRRELSLKLNASLSEFKELES